LTVIGVCNSPTIALSMTMMYFTRVFTNIQVVDSINFFGFVNPIGRTKIFARYTEFSLVFMYGYIEIFDVASFVIAYMFGVISFNQ
tara:strand:- start:2488 stop:2745 length:258 start_codon:yes stop_codon:yes gene_type:complete